MRAIRFRVWDKANCVMIADPFAWDDVKEQILHSDGSGLVPNAPISRYEIMQYTGLKDKNGADICEGDIVESDGDVRQIRYTDLGCGFVAAHLHDFNCYCDFPQPFIRHGGCEVIGNIHENPSLLEGK